jgi:hypothetical protein
MKPPKDLLLLPDGELGISRIPFSIIPFNKAYRIFGTLNLGKNHLAFSQSPSGFNGILRMIRKPKIVLIEVIEGDGKILGDVKRNGFHLFSDHLMVEMVRLNDLMEMVHPQSDHSVTTWSAVDFPQCGTLRTPFVAALPEAL